MSVERTEPNGFYRVAIAFASGGSSILYAFATPGIDPADALAHVVDRGVEWIRVSDLDGCTWLFSKKELASIVVTHIPERMPTNTHHAHVIAMHRDELRTAAACEAEGLPYTTFLDDTDEGELPGERNLAAKDRPN